MVAKTYINANLRRIDGLFRGATSARQAELLAKLATLELCGWLEVSMDDIVLRTARRVLVDARHRTSFDNEVVKKVNGFSYESHFKRLLRGLIGMRGVAQVETRVDPALFVPMCSALTTLKSVRDRHAHTYLKGVTLTLDAPSATRAKFALTYAGLKDIEAVLRVLYP
jgi:hypothetical protein